MPDDSADPRLLVPREDARIQKLEQEVSDLRDALGSLASRTAAPDFGLINTNIGLLASRATALETFIKGLEGQNGIDVHGNKIILSWRPPPTVPNFGLSMDLTVYDTDETTVLYTGTQELFSTVDDAGTQVQMFYVWTEFCIDEDTFQSLVLRSLNE